MLQKPESMAEMAVAAQAELDACGMDLAIEKLLFGIQERAMELEQPALLRIIAELRRRETAGRSALRNARARRRIG